MVDLPAGSVPELRIDSANGAAARPERDFVLYWMTAARRTAWNFGLDRALDLAEGLKKPLVVLEALRVDYPWASDRLHAFVLHGMADNQRALAERDALYLPYVEPAPGAGRGLLEALARRACVVVTDHYPTFFLPRMVAAAGRRLDVRLEVVDSLGLLPLRATDRAFTTAFSFRAFLQKNLAPHLERTPRARPFSHRDLPAPPSGLLDEVLERWPAADEALLRAEPAALAALPLDHAVPVVEGRGGRERGRRELREFLERRLGRYDEERNDPVETAASGLSPYLHFGHISVHEVMDELARREDWSPACLDRGGNGGRREGWWRTSAPTEAFLDELVTWRELGHVFCHHRPADHDRFESLPRFALETLREHAGDERPYLYDLEAFEAAATHDELWNAAQRQLLREGTIHNYLRMLWGKKILHWTASPEEALRVMVELNNRHALDGRDPNSYSGIFWVLGRFDRAWGPEREVFGKVRYMTSDSTARKLNVKPYLERHSAQASLFG